MKKSLIAVVLMTASVVMANPYHHHGGHHRGYHNHYPHHHNYNRHYYRGNADWVVPAIIGGAVIYGLSQRQSEPTPVVVQQPVIVQQPAIVQQNCTPWTETANYDGSITRTRTCY